MKPEEHVMQFFEEGLHLPTGERFVPAKKWQEPHLRKIFGTLRSNGTRQYRTAYWELPKKSGKSTLSAGVALYGLFGDGEPNAQIYLVASTRDQANIVFRHAATMVRQSPGLSKRCRIIESTKTIINLTGHNSFLRAVSADAGTQDGVEPHFCIFDEVHRQRDRGLWSVMRKGMSTRRNPLMWAITTAGIASETPLCWELHEYAVGVRDGVLKDPSFYPVIYALDEDEDWTLEKNWKKANPALGDFKRLDALKEDFLQAVRSPGLENEFRRFELNQWVSQETRWISLHEWDKAELFDPNELVGEPCYAGLDLSTTQDVTAFVLLFPVDGNYHVIPHFWLPRETAEKGTSIPYAMWSKQGLMTLTDGNVIDYRVIQERINELADIYNIQEIAFDPWNATQVSIELEDDGFKMVPVRQGFMSLNPPSKAFEACVLAGQIRHNSNPILRWMLDCASIKQDPAGNIKPVKPDRRSTTKRIDGIVAAIMALDRVIRHKPKVSIYDSPETAVM